MHTIFYKGIISLLDLIEVINCFKLIFGVFMIIVPLKEGENVDRALKKLKRKFEKTGTLREVRERQKYTKPSVKKREEKLKAIYVQKLKEKENL